MTYNEQKGFKLEEYKGFMFYKENPSLSVWERIELIFRDSNIIQFS